LSDAQAGHEKTISALLPAMAGANLIYGPGMLEMGMTFSFGQLVIDDEIAAMVKRVVYGIDCNATLMGVDLIKEIGIGGHFLTQAHTLDYLRSEQIQSRVIDRRVREEWEDKGSNSMIQSANEMAKQLIQNHKPDPLPKELASELRRIVASAEV
jgi:trimethylamine--corrinoid protein Co-methyltransferase